MKFTVEKKGQGLSRAGKIETLHGVINTPAFVVVGTKATVKAMTPIEVRETGAEVVLANTYHLYLEPGEKILRTAGGLGRFMNWDGPTMTDSGGFQVFSLGSDFDTKAGKVLPVDHVDEERTTSAKALAKIDEDGVTFKSYKDGSEHRFTPERSMEIQHAIGADIIFAFDECTSPHAPHSYQKEALERTHRWAKRSLEYHQKHRSFDQALFGIVQGGRFEDLRKQSAKAIGEMEFDGFGIGGSFAKEDMGNAVRWVNEILPEGKPRHLLGIGEPEDLFHAVLNGCDTFDCVSPTRMGRNGTLYTKTGKMNMMNAAHVSDFLPIEPDCDCATCQNFTRAYLSHLFRSKEMLAGTLASIHNVHFLVQLAKKMRASILEGTFKTYMADFLAKYKKS